MALASYTPPLTSQSTIGTCSYGGWVRPVNGVRGVGAVGPASHSCHLLRLLQLRNSRPNAFLRDPDLRLICTLKGTPS